MICSARSLLISSSCGSDDRYHIEMRLCLLVLLCLTLFVSTAGAATTPRQTEAGAEQAILLAQRMLKRWGVGLVNPHTGLIRDNVWVGCSGRGRGERGRHTHFRCVVGHQTTRVTVTYVVLRGNGFEVRNRRITRD